MPAIKGSRGYAEDAAGCQRMIHRLSKDEESPRDFVEENIADLTRVVERFNRHTRDRAKSSTKAAAAKPKTKNGNARPTA